MTTERPGPDAVDEARDETAADAGGGADAHDESEGPGSPRTSPADDRTAATVAALREEAGEVRREELATALARPETEAFTDGQRAVLADLADAIVEGLVSGPTSSLLAAGDAATAETAADLFDLEVEDRTSTPRSGHGSGAAHPAGDGPGGQPPTARTETGVADDD